MPTLPTSALRRCLSKPKPSCQPASLQVHVAPLPYQHHCLTSITALSASPLIPGVSLRLSLATAYLPTLLQVQDAPLSYQHQHASLVSEFRNETHWPKHLLVRYHYKTENDVDLDRGLYVLFAAGRWLGWAPGKSCSGGWIGSQHGPSTC
jgi:hypothetical protein